MKHDDLKEGIERGAQAVRIICAVGFCAVVLVVMLPLLLKELRQGDGVGVIICAVLAVFFCTLPWPNDD